MTVALALALVWMLAIVLLVVVGVARLDRWFGYLLLFCGLGQLALWIAYLPELVGQSA